MTNKQMDPLQHSLFVIARSLRRGNLSSKTRLPRSLVKRASLAMTFETRSMKSRHFPLLVCLLISLLVYWSIPALPVFADEPFKSEIGGLNTGYQGKGTTGAAGTLETIVSKTIGFITVAGGVAFLIYLLLAGFTWITAREEAERMSKAKQMLTNALIGLAIMVSAWAFAGIMGTVFGFDILNLAALLNCLTPTATSCP